MNNVKIILLLKLNSDPALFEVVDIMTTAALYRDKGTLSYYEHSIIYNRCCDLLQQSKAIRAAIPES